ncbi:MAG TPA: beta-galactosidase, partial [Acidobacteriaceae bacterium]
MPAEYHGGTATNPSGRTIGVNSRYLLLDGKPWLPVMGEFHYSRVPESEWETELLKMKAAGVQIVSTYIFWIHQEEVQGQFDWTGQRDLRHFVQLCAKDGLYVYPRLGPWAHGEVRNGGFPDWLLKLGPTRRNTPAFMAQVALYYSQIADQLRGLLWKDGGPIIGVQIENEYAARGPSEGADYLLALKRLAIAKGMDVPLYSLTGWDNAVLPPGEFLPVYGGYPDAPWDGSISSLPPQEVYAFRFHSRVTGDMGMMRGKDSAIGNRPAPVTPFITAEMGGGVQDTYHRRPVISADDIAAMMPVMLGSGVNLYGTYIFQGGVNPEGKLSTLQESQSTGYPTDVPVRSYDFQAPLSSFGLERQSLRKMKVFNYFLQDFGSALAPMAPIAPAIQPKDPADLSVPRLAIRGDGESGFLFFNNYTRNAR